MKYKKTTTTYLEVSPASHRKPAEASRIIPAVNLSEIGLFATPKLARHDAMEPQPKTKYPSKEKCVIL